MRLAWPIVALALTGCLALVNHDRPWPCDSDADCQDGEKCQSKLCQPPTPASSSDAGSSAGLCCLDGVGQCQCYTAPIVCQSTSGGGDAACSCGQLGGQDVTDKCSLPTLAWATCCLSTLEGTCNCYTNGASCNATLETEVQSCTAAATGMTGATCKVSGGSCTCDGIGIGDGQCPPALTAVCCQSSSECHCNYGGSCFGSEQNVPSCSASALQSPTQCPTGQSPVASCR
jgi:hypothetical protein